MISHAKESPTFQYELDTQLDALRTNKIVREIPSKSLNKLLVATWNLTNFGVQKRKSDDLVLMAEIISWFDLVAIQEIADDLTDLRILLSKLPSTYAVIISDIAGNAERAGFIYDTQKVERLELAAEVAVPPKDHKHIRMKGVSGTFSGFDRNPYAVAFRSGDIEFTAVCAHLFFGSHKYYDQDRRALETFALAKWADKRHKAAGAYSQNILVMGDLNLPTPDDRSNVYRALKEHRLILPKHSTTMGSNLKGDKHYDQVAFNAGGMKNYYNKKSGVFDFDKTPFFREAWDRSPLYFNRTVKYHIADHRPLWAQFNI